MLSGMISRSRSVLLGTAALMVVTTLTACLPKDAETGAGDPTAAPVNVTSLPPECSKSNMPVKNPGKLIVGIPEKTAAPWFVGDKPAKGEGFEAAVVLAVAKKLGYVPADLTWLRVPDKKLTAAGLKEFDIGIGQLAMAEDLRSVVDFTGPYLNVPEVVVALKDSKIANATNFGDLKSARLGARLDTDSHKMITTVVQPSAEATGFKTSAEATKALRDGSIDGLVVDLPTGFRLAAEIKDAKVVGQLPLAVAQPRQFTLVLEKDSLVTRCFSLAVESLRADKTLDQLEQQWLVQAAPKLG